MGGCRVREEPVAIGELAKLTDHRRVFVVTERVIRREQTGSSLDSAD